MNINWISPITPHTSYGICGINFIIQLSKLGHNIALFPIGRPELDKIHTQSIKEMFDKAIYRGHYEYDKEAPCIRLYHQFSQSEFVGQGQHIAFPIFELNHFTRLEQAQLSRVDRIITCSKWGASIVNSEISRYADVVPLGYDNLIYKKKRSKSPNTIFLHIGKTEIRKSSKEIVDGFNLAFNKDDNVELWLAWTSIFNKPEEQQEWDRYAKNSKLGEKIKIIPRLQSCAEVSELIQSSDCIVSLSKAEGWNLPALEGLACAKYVIATNNTAQTEFLNSDNAFLVETPDLEDAWDGKWFLGKDFEVVGQWHKIGNSEIEQFVSYLRRIHELKLDFKIESNYDISEFTWENSTKKLLEIL